MEILVVSKYATVPGFGANPRWHNLGKYFVEWGHQVCVITSDSNHATSLTLNSSQSIASFKYDGVSFFVINTLKYSKSASAKRVLSWFDFDVKLFRFFHSARPDVVVVSSLSPTAILFGAYLKFRFGSSLVFEIRDIWPLTLIEEGGYSKWHPFSLFLKVVESFGYRYADLLVGTMPNLKQHVSDCGIRKSKEYFHTCGIGVSEPNLDQSHSFAFDANIEDQIIGKTVIGYCGSIGLTNNLHDFVNYIENSKS